MHAFYDKEIRQLREVQAQNVEALQATIRALSARDDEGRRAVSRGALGGS